MFRDAGKCKQHLVSWLSSGVLLGAGKSKLQVSGVPRKPDFEVLIEAWLILVPHSLGRGGNALGVCERIRKTPRAKPDTKWHLWQARIIWVWVLPEPSHS